MYSIQRLQDTRCTFKGKLTFLKSISASESKDIFNYYRLYRESRQACMDGQSKEVKYLIVDREINRIVSRLRALPVSINVFSCMLLGIPYYNLIPYLQMLDEYQT